MSAGTASQIVFRRHATEFEGFADILLDRFLDLVQFLLRIEETAGDGIIEQGLAMLFEIGHFLASYRERLLLFLLQELAFVHEAIVKGTGLLIIHESIDPLANGSHIRLIQDGLAQFLGFSKDHRFFDNSWHTQY